MLFYVLSKIDEAKGESVWADLSHIVHQDAIPVESEDVNPYLNDEFGSVFTLAEPITDTPKHEHDFDALSEYLYTFQDLPVAPSVEPTVVPSEYKLESVLQDVEEHIDAVAPESVSRDESFIETDTADILQDENYDNKLENVALDVTSISTEIDSPLPILISDSSKEPVEVQAVDSPSSSSSSAVIVADEDNSVLGQITPSIESLMIPPISTARYEIPSSR